MKYYTFEVGILTADEIGTISFDGVADIYKKIAEVLNLKEANFLSPLLKLEHETN